MNEWLKKIVEQIKTAWGKWKLVQKLAVIGIGVALIAAIIITIAVSRTPTMVRLINTPIKSDEELRLITNALDREGIPFQVGENNIIYVKDEKTRSKANAILLREDLIPKGTDPWAVFSIDRFTVTDFERNVNLRKAIIAQVTRHINLLMMLIRQMLLLRFQKISSFPKIKSL